MAVSVSEPAGSEISVPMVMAPPLMLRVLPSPDASDSEVPCGGVLKKTFPLAPSVLLAPPTPVTSGVMAAKLPWMARPPLPSPIIPLVASRVTAA